MIKSIILGILLVSTLACKGTKKASSIDENKNRTMTAKETRNATVNDPVRTEPESLGEKNYPGGVVSETSGNTGGMDNVQMSPAVSTSISDADAEKMFKALQMTDEQIQTFETAMADYKGSVASGTEGKMGTIGNEQERQLKDMLDRSQWKKYLKWQKNGKP